MDPPTDTTKKKEFIINDAKAKAIIIQGVSDKHLDIIKDTKTAKDILIALQAMFVRSSTFSKLTLWRKLFNLKCGYRDKLEDHFLKFDSIIRELEDLGSKIDDSDKVCHLLLSLSKEYDTVITALETLPDIKIDFVKARLLDEEMKIKTKCNNNNVKSDSMEVSFKAASTGSGCYNCGDKRHFIAHCPKKNSRGRGRGPRGYSRGGKGRFLHFNNVNSEVAKTSSEITFVAINNNKNTNIKLASSDIFIIDSGASNHMVKEELVSKMTHVEKLDHEVTIFIANGDEMKSSMKGVLRLFCQNRVINVEALVDVYKRQE